MKEAQLYANSVKTELAHTFIDLIQLEDNQERSKGIHSINISESKLVEIITHINKHMSIHSIILKEGELLLVGYTRSNIGFLLHIEVSAIKINYELVKQEMLHLQKHVIVAYFVRGR